MSNYSWGWSEDSKYHGLINQGATCYLNSVLQVLFMTKDFREAVGRDTSANHIDIQLQSLFNTLKRQTAETVGVTKKLGINRVCEQRDAAEHFEKILTLTSDEAAQIFRGELVHKTICSGCGTESDDDADFWDLPLALVNSCGESYSVEAGIREFFRDSEFSGENQMYCDTCSAKCDATAKCAMKHHPEVLMLLLKRFEFSYNHMSFVKNSCHVDVPSTLKIPENQMYELYAFVEHFGSLQGGHYTATIKSQDDDNRWYCFNDSSVTLLNNQPFRKSQTQRTSSAYLLFYRKKITGTQYIREGSNNGGPPFDTIQNYEQSRDDNDNDGNEGEGKGGKRKADDQTERNKDKMTVSMKRKMEVHEERSEVKKEKTEADRLASRTDKQLEEYDSLKNEKDMTSVGPKQNIPNKHEQQGDRKMNVQGDERMAGVKKHPLRDEVHDKQNIPNKTQDDKRERNTSHNKLHDRQKEPTEWREMVDKEGMGGKAEGNDQAARGKDMSTQKKSKTEVKTDSGGKTGQKEKEHEEKIKGKKGKIEAGGRAARNDQQLEKQTRGVLESQKDFPVHKPSKHHGNKMDDEHYQIEVEPSPKQAQLGKAGREKQGAGSDKKSGKGNFLSRLFRRKSKAKKSRQSAEQGEGGAGTSHARHYESEDEETTGCFQKKKKKSKKKSAGEKTNKQ